MKEGSGNDQEPPSGVYETTEEEQPKEPPSGVYETTEEEQAKTPVYETTEEEQPKTPVYETTEEEQPKKLPVKDQQIQQVVSTESTAGIHSKLAKLTSISIYDQQAALEFYGKGGMLNLETYKNIRRYQLEYKITEGKDLKNIYIDPAIKSDTDDASLAKLKSQLKDPIFFGENGEPICVYKDAKLGKGNYGDVVVGIRLDNGELCAIKKQTLEKAQEAAYEKDTLKQMGRHVETFQTNEEDVSIEYDAQKLVLGQSLQNLMNDNKKNGIQMSTTDVISIARGASAAVKEFHEKGYLHRDLQAGNIMRLPTGECKLVDFGLAVHTGPSLKILSNNDCGQILVGAPDKVGRQVLHSDKSDVYSMGAMLAMLCSNKTNLDVQQEIRKPLGLLPKDSLTEVDQSKICAKLKEVLGDIYDDKKLPSDPIRREAVLMIRKMTDEHPEKRPTMSEVNTFFKKIEVENTLGNLLTKNGESNSSEKGNTLDSLQSHQLTFSHDMKSSHKSNVTKTEAKVELKTEVKQKLGR